MDSLNSPLTGIIVPANDYVIVQVQMRFRSKTPPGAKLFVVTAFRRDSSGGIYDLVTDKLTINVIR